MFSDHDIADAGTRPFNVSFFSILVKSQLPLSARYGSVNVVISCTCSDLLGGHMNKLLQLLGYKVSDKTGFSVRLGWCSEVWAWGWFDVYVPFGLGIFVVGPLQVRITWPISNWPPDGFVQN
jgi:hypothetical protein